MKKYKLKESGDFHFYFGCKFGLDVTTVYKQTILK